MAEARLFTNWTAEDFTHTWDGVEYTFKTGQSIYLQDYLANHFAKHLVDRELNKQGIPTNHFSRESLVNKCFGESVKVETQAQAEMVQLNVQAKPSSDIDIKKEESKEEKKSWCGQCDSKGVKHKKECPTLKKEEINPAFNV